MVEQFSGLLTESWAPHCWAVCLTSIAVSDVQMNTRVGIRDACEEAKEGGRRQRKRGEIPLPPGEDK